MRFVATALFLLSATPAFSAESGDLWPAALKSMGALLFVLAVILLLYALVQRKLPGLNGGRNGEIKIIENRYLAPRRSISLIEVRGQTLLLGVGQERIEVLARLDEVPKEDFASLLDEREEAACDT